MTTLFHDALYATIKEIKTNLGRKKLHRKNHGSSILGGSFSNRDNLKAPVQFRDFIRASEKLFFIRDRLIHFQTGSTTAI